MKQNKKTTTKNNKTTRAQATASAVGSRKDVILASLPYSQNDFKNSLLIVSLMVNAFFLSAWLTTLVSADFAYVIGRAIAQL